MPLEMPDILNYLSATYMTGFLATDTEFATDANNTPSLNEQIDVNSKDVPETAMSKEAQKNCRSVERTTSRPVATPDA